MSSLNRRDFLRIISAGTCGAAIHRVLSPCNSLLAFGTPRTAPALGPDSVLVVVNLAGGCSYNLTPVYHGAYRDKNPDISYGPENSLPLNSEQGLHPSLTGLKTIWDEGNLALINMVGYENPNRSHAESTEIWQRGLVNGSASTQGGWAARLTCQVGRIFGGISLAGSNTFTSGDCFAPQSFGDLENFGEREFLWSTERTMDVRNARDQIIALSTPDENENHNYLKRSMDDLKQSVEVVKAATDVQLPVTFPNTSFGNSCRDAAKLIVARTLGVKIIYLEKGGFDTHTNERPALTNLLNDLNASLTALVNALKAVGRWGDVTIMTMSEFSRTFQNGSEGTDHGHAAPMLVMGGNVRGGSKTPPPTPAETTGSYYADYHVDFREPYKAAVQAMGYNGDIVFPEQFNLRNLDLFL